MQLFRSARWLLLALLLSVLPASLHAQITISVGSAPPMLPVYEQPICPEPNLIWAPGYWAYGDDDYYWVPGAWVEPPYEGALWTPNYWGWSGGHYRFHRGYWGHHVGYYGGVDYGYGYGGIGFSGGEWRGHEFAYNTAVMRVNETVIHTTYVDRTIVERDRIPNERHVAYNGGPGGIQHQPRPEELAAAREQHTAPTTFQTQHVTAARADKTSYAKANGGHPQNVVAARPLGVEKHAPAAGPGQGKPNQPAPQAQQHPQPVGQQHPTPAAQQHPTPKAESRSTPKAEPRPTPQAQPRPTPKAESRPTPKAQPRPTPQAQPRPTPQAQPRPTPQAQPRPTPQAQPRPTPQAQPRPTPQAQPRPAPQAQHAAPAPKEEHKPK